MREPKEIKKVIIHAGCEYCNGRLTLTEMERGGGLCSYCFDDEARTKGDGTDNA